MQTDCGVGKARPHTHELRASCAAAPRSAGRSRRLAARRRQRCESHRLARRAAWRPDASDELLRRTRDFSRSDGDAARTNIKAIRAAVIADYPAFAAILDDHFSATQPPRSKSTPPAELESLLIRAEAAYAQAEHAFYRLSKTPNTAANGGKDRRVFDAARPQLIDPAGARVHPRESRARLAFFAAIRWRSSTIASKPPSPRR